MGNLKSNMVAHTKYTPVLAKEICERLADGETLTNICNRAINPGMPTPRTVYNWVDGDTEFAARFERARKTGCEVVLDQALDIAHAPLRSDDLAVKPADILLQRKIQIATHFKFIARVNPAKYGDRVTEGDKTEKVEVIINTHPGPASVANADKPTE